MTEGFSLKMNDSDLRSNTTTASFLLLPVFKLVNDHAMDNTLDTTENNQVSISNKQCVDGLSTQTPIVTTFPGSLDALFYIIVVLLFYAFSIVVLMVKYIRREREEANLRNYYIEFVARDKFQSTQYKNQQVMKRTTCKESEGDGHADSTMEDVTRIIQSVSDQKHQRHAIALAGCAFDRPLMDSAQEDTNKVGFTFLGAKNHVCKNGFFARTFCNKQLCSKCVSESVPTIDWDDGRTSGIDRRNKQEQNVEDGIELRSCSEKKCKVESNFCKKSNQKHSVESNRLLERDIFFPIIECDSDVENEEETKQRNDPSTWVKGHDIFHANYDATIKHNTILPHYSLDISNFLAAKIPQLDAVSTYNDMDTLDGLSNLGSEAGSQSLLDYSNSVKCTNSIFGGQFKDSPVFFNKSGSGDDRVKDLSDFLSERTSLLSCTLSIDDDDEDILTNLSSSKHHPNGISIHSSGNGKLKDTVISNGKAILNSLSKSLSSDEGDRKKFANDLTNLTDDSGVFKNLKYFLRGFSKDGKVKEAYETLNLLPRETCFGHGSPQSLFGNPKHIMASTKCARADEISFCAEKVTLKDSWVNDNKCDISEDRRYTYDTDYDFGSDGDRSSSFGDYFMGEANLSQVIDISQPLVRRQFDSKTKDILSQAFVELCDPKYIQNPPENPTNNVLTGCTATGRETNVTGCIATRRETNV